VKTLSCTILIGLLGTSVLCLADEKQNSNQRPQNQQTNQQPKKEAYLGVSVEAIPPVMRSQMPDLLPMGQGVLVDRVAKDSPAAKAGIQPNDILLTIGDQKIGSPDELVRMIRGNAAGQTVNVGYLRAGKAATYKITLGENPPRMEQYQTGPGNPGNPNVFRLFPDDRLIRLFEENEVMNGDKNWTTFDSMKLSRSDGNKWNAEIEFRTKDGTKESKKFSGTRPEIRKQIQEEKDLPESEKNHLLRALNLRPPVFEFQFPPIGSIPPDAGLRP
jgi:membrane-associated protease RseP (regulator of RpoE activity)